MKNFIFVNHSPLMKSTVKSLLVFLGALYFFSFCRNNANAREDFVEKRASLRAYIGAPPAIPHPVVSNSTANCLNCHGKGVIFDKDAVVFGMRNAVAKITPHPGWVNCQQCHVAQNDVSPFRENTFTTFHLAHPAKGKKAAGAEEEGTPPKMPHQKENRENCPICHLSKTADPSIVPKHGPRDGCEFCHTPPESLAIYPDGDEY